MDEVIQLTNLLPKYEDFKHLLVNENEANYILSMAQRNVQQIQGEYAKNSSETTFSSTELEEASFLVQALIDKFWENIHTGNFSEVPLETRKIYSIACYFKIIYNLFSSLDELQLEKCSEILDDSLLLGYDQELYNGSEIFKRAVMKFLDEKLGTRQVELMCIDRIEYKEYPCDIPILQCPSVDDFDKNYFATLKPALLRGTIDHWPALSKWKDLNHILKVAGNRTVPIEIGSNYTTDDWSQQLMKIRDFLKRQFGAEPQEEVEYLAQHELFDQIPELKEDIQIPKYCSLGNNPNQVNIKAWLGPKGTISPMHQDPKHNLLCQVFGVKKIILASPQDTEFLYAHETEFLHNTSQINAEHLDLETFPLAKNVKFYHLILQEGECLYIPPKWWHYVRSKTKSFSVSFWWQ